MICVLFERGYGTKTFSRSHAEQKVLNLYNKMSHNTMVPQRDTDLDLLALFHSLNITRVIRILDYIIPLTCN